MKTVTANFTTTVRQMAEMFQWPICLSEKKGWSITKKSWWHWILPHKRSEVLVARVSLFVGRIETSEKVKCTKNIVTAVETQLLLHGHVLKNETEDQPSRHLKGFAVLKLNLKKRCFSSRRNYAKSDNDSPVSHGPLKLRQCPSCWEKQNSHQLNLNARKHYLLKLRWYNQDRSRAPSMEKQQNDQA